MARALENPEAIPDYLEFFGMSRAPFARLSDSSEVFHAEQYSRLYALLADATERSDRLLALFGTDGSGKTTLLDRYIATLDHETSFASFDDTCVDATQFYCELLRQLGFSDITGTLNELQHIAKEFLLHRGLAGDPVLLIVDNAHLVSPSILEQLRWLGGIKLQGHCVISLVLAGNTDLERIMASPAMSLLSFGHRVDFGVRVLTERETDDYVRHRLRLAGGSESTQLSTRARPLIHRFSGGNPRLINRLCDTVLREALAQKTRVISESLLRKIAQEQEFVPHVVPLQGQGRRASDRDVLPEPGEPIIEERIVPQGTRRRPERDDSASKPEATDVGITELLAQVAALAEQLDASKAQTEKALRDIDVRDGDINALLKKVARQGEALEQAERAANGSAAEIHRLGQLLQASQEPHEALRDELTTEKRTARKTTTRLVKATRRLEKLDRLRADLQASIRDLKAERRKSTAQNRRELKARDSTISELQDTLAGLREENDALQSRVQAAARLEEVVTEKQARIEALERELESQRQNEDATQLHEAIDQTGSRSSTALPDGEKYTGEISALEIFRHGELEQVVTLEACRRRLIIGRSDDSELCLASKFVSRHHALIVLTRERACIENLRSYNGTIVNGKKISRCDLNLDDTITIGDFELRPRQL